MQRLIFWSIGWERRVMICTTLYQRKRSDVLDIKPGEICRVLYQSKFYKAKVLRIGTSCAELITCKAMLTMILLSLYRHKFRNEMSKWYWEGENQWNGLLLSIYVIRSAKIKNYPKSPRKYKVTAKEYMLYKLRSGVCPISINSNIHELLLYN